MSTQHHGNSSRLKRLSGAVALCILMILGIGANSAQAHSSLISSTPANGAVLDVAPTSVTFTFEEELLPDLATVSINDAKGVNISSQKIVPADHTLNFPWPADLPAGSYEVGYRVVSADGHPITGAISFSFGNPSTSPSTMPSPVPEASSADPQESSLPPLAIASAVVLLGLSIAVIYVLVKRRR